MSCFDNDFISVVIAGDGQMHPDDMTAVLDPIAENKADYVKGERLDRAGKMPVHRQIGTFLLSILTTLACGQTIRDSQCGYTATSSQVLKSWDWENSWKGYAEERLGPSLKTMNALVSVIEGMPLIYGGQESNLQKRLRFFEKDTIEWKNYELTQHYQALFDIKKKNKALWNGNYGGEPIIISQESEDALVIYRTKDEHELVLVFNLSFELNSKGSGYFLPIMAPNLGTEDINFFV